MNWALDRFTRFDKTATGQRHLTYRQALERAHEQRKQRLAEAGAGETVGALVPGGLDQPPSPKVEAQEKEDTVLRALEAEIPVPPELKDAQVDTRPPGSALTPLERGSFKPRMDEYLDEVIPADISTAEEQLRWRELRQTERAYEARVAKRKPGRAKCQGVPIDARGHDWFKVPAQMCWECMECGLEASVGNWNLVKGKMHAVAAYKTGRAQKMFAALAAGDVAFMSPGAVELAEKKRQLMLKEASRPEVPTGMDDFAAMEVLSLNERTTFEEGESGACLNCGAPQVVHRRVKEERAKILGVQLYRTTLRCPQHGVDAT